MLEYIKKLLHRHKWETVFVNKYYHPTVQVCKGCPLTREIKICPTKSLSCYWEYSNGDESVCFDFGEQEKY